MSDKTDMKAESPVAAATSSRGSIACNHLQSFGNWQMIDADAWALIQGESGECRVFGRDLMSAYMPDGQFKLPSRFDMSSSDWGKGIKPDDLAKKLGFSGDLANSINIATWRRGRIRADQSIDPGVRQSIVGKIARHINALCDDLEPKP